MILIIYNSLRCKKKKQQQKNLKKIVIGLMFQESVDLFFYFLRTILFCCKYNFFWFSKTFLE